MQQKAPIPSASAQNRVAWSSSIPSRVLAAGQSASVPRHVATLIQMYSASTIQNTGPAAFSSKSRTVPPPTAVTVPTSVQPSTSMPAREAVTHPLIANAAVPK